LAPALPSATFGKFWGGWKFALVIVIHQAGSVAPDGKEPLVSTSQAGGQVFSLRLSSSKMMVYLLFPFEPNLFATVFSSVKELTGEEFQEFTSKL
jgi:hypothetical protein